MSDEPTLFDDEALLFPVDYEDDEELSIEQRASIFHHQNPHVMEALVGLARRLQIRGHYRYGIAGLFEVLRYRHAISTSGDEFKLNNSFRAWYAREIMRRYPHLDGFFELRKAGSDRAPLPE